MSKTSLSSCKVPSSEAKPRKDKPITRIPEELEGWETLRRNIRFFRGIAGKNLKPLSLSKQVFLEELRRRERRRKF